LIKLDGFGVASVGSAQLSQSGQSAIISGMDIERGQVRIVSRRSIPRLKLILSQFVVEPGKVLRGQPGFRPGRDRVLHQADRAGGVAGNKPEIRGTAV